MNLRKLAGLLRPRPKWWLGRPYRITITAASEGGYWLQIHHTQGTEWIALPIRIHEDGHPDDRVFAVAAEALTARRLRWVLPWELDANADLTAPVTTLTGPEVAQ